MGPGEHREVLEAFRMFAHDRGWIRRLREAVATGLTAEAAVERVQNDARAKLQRQTDPYMRERLHDLDDLANRLLHQLTGRSFVTAHADLPDNSIIVARTMGPAALLDYDRAKLRGLVLEDAGASSHVAIVARALRHRGRRRRRQYHRFCRAGRCLDRRWRLRRRACAPAARCRACLCRKGAAARPAAGAISQAARCARRHQGRRRDRAAS